MSEKDFSEADFDEFAKKFSDYLAKANESKKRGNNDYNPLKAVQNPNDEVNMHSGFLVSLLDTRGEHYQDDLFLRLFLENLKLKDCGNDENLGQWFGETKNAQVFKEYKNIDIYISNGEKHIIIENKIWYDDRDGQIARYTNEIHANSSDDESVSYENIAVVYLSPFGREPSPNSLCLKNKNIKWQIKGDLLEFNENKVKYKQISYEKDILAWIEKCQKEVGNITSLNSALEFYKDIVEIITYKKESKMNIAGFFGENADGIKELSQEKRFEIAFEICKNEDEIMRAYLANIENDIRDSVKERVGESWRTELLDGILFVENEKYGDELVGFIFDIEWAIEEKNKIFSCWLYVEGLSELEGYDKKNMENYKQKLQKHLSQELNGKELIIHKKKFIYIDFKNIDELSNSKEIFLNFIEKYTDLADKLNEKLKTFKI